MKKTILSLSILLSLGLVSCGEQQSQRYVISRGATNSKVIIRLDTKTGETRYYNYVANNWTLIPEAKEKKK